MYTLRDVSSRPDDYPALSSSLTKLQLAQVSLRPGFPFVKRPDALHWQGGETRADITPRKEMAWLKRGTEERRRWNVSSQASNEFLAYDTFDERIVLTRTLLSQTSRFTCQFHEAITLPPSFCCYKYSFAFFSHFIIIIVDTCTYIYFLAHGLRSKSRKIVTRLGFIRHIHIFS